VFREDDVGDVELEEGFPDLASRPEDFSRRRALSSETYFEIRLVYCEMLIF
jgi:hypothetical protein